MSQTSRRRLGIAFAVLLVTIVVGTAGFMALSNLTVTEALYVTVVTIATAGATDVHQLTDAGRLFTIGIIFVGVGTVAYAFGSLVEQVVVNQLPETWARRRRRRMLEQVKDHQIICGFGRIGRQIAQEFSNLGVPFVIVDSDAAAVELCAQAGYLCLLGDATADSTLEQAGIVRARGLLTALDSDAENLYVVLTARGMRQDIFIVARADFEQSESKMLRAGADRVLSPPSLGGRRMAALALRPNVVQFLDVLTHTQDLQLWLEEVLISQGSPLIGTTLETAELRQRTGALVLAVFQPDGTLVTNPPPNMGLEAGARAIALGTRDQLRSLCELVETGSCTLS